VQDQSHTGGRVDRKGGMMPLPLSFSFFLFLSLPFLLFSFLPFFFFLSILFLSFLSLYLLCFACFRIVALSNLVAFGRDCWETGGGQEDYHHSV
jgi:hypothetical protein